MSRYIDADLLYWACLTFKDENGVPRRIPDYDIDNFPNTLNVKDVRKAIIKAPSADVEPLKHGYWDDSIDGITPYCSICGQSHRLMTRTPNYCPYCGAKMDEEAEK